ncbi:bifunctional adenosylcobinamide kinase / adenosylcobinamide-phosphate guanylyltransferase [Synechococcus sp. BIOS-E4-1]|uniref:bifunctional adenosylcobinamide kinase/adenosylcobinamide-phosphate guanylyltransferase n=1 Tax=Synechococcus sp. BIOS-E4-1 TaxID=1400864 RepID=UPI0016455430|nr:bifunctional adenosylcobinamide kinase/adenosylcobinamide-phosphate guanylyltransferase [Synechococcus sp. BIOS-E4-1]QNI54710.1 bifunctional adenosylcobinamide kinase / adenosylcobinamide-phosphate guanylyltransferase [Synechococcus sp. BIOS-E4-1]
MVKPLDGLVLVCGPSRGGKSRWAEHLVAQYSPVSYIATSDSRPDDSGWQQRIRLHRDRRPPHWEVIESGADLSLALDTIPTNHTVLVDALGAFTAWHLEASPNDWAQLEADLIKSLQQRQRPVVLVIEETGWGVVPATAIGGRFRDRQGQLAQQLDTIASASWLVVQGRALDLHALGCPLPQE